MSFFRCFLIPLCFVADTALAEDRLFESHQFSKSDAIYVVDQTGHSLYQWQPEKALIPASLTKLVTTYLSLEKWGAQHRFMTEYYTVGEQLWIKGSGDPYLVSEELDLLAAQLRRLGVNAQNATSINLDNSYFKLEPVPGRSNVDDPYNAPLSAIAANFNTVKLQKLKGIVSSAEKQTPLTDTAARLASNIGALSAKPQRVNLKTANNAQRHFAEILASKLGLKSVAIEINQQLPKNASLLHRYISSRTLEDNLKATLEYSNNFIANQLYLKLTEKPELNQLAFSTANAYAQQQLSQLLGWSEPRVFDGSGLSRDNRLSAMQIDQVLSKIEDQKTLLKRVSKNKTGFEVYAKTGTLNGVRSYAGFIRSQQSDYRFVFVFNRTTPYRFREQLLDELLDYLSRKT